MLEVFPQQADIVDKYDYITLYEIEEGHFTNHAIMYIDDAKLRGSFQFFDELHVLEIEFHEGKITKIIQTSATC